MRSWGSRGGEVEEGQEVDVEKKYEGGWMRWGMW